MFEGKVEMSSIPKQIHVFIARLRKQHQANPLLFWLRVAVLGFITYLFTVKHNFWTPDTLFVLLLGVFVVFGQARAFLYRFAPFIALLLVYDSFRSIADQLNRSVHYTEMVHADHALFAGILPTAWLQHVLWHGQVQWYDFYFYFLYTMHFVAPILLAVLIWKQCDRLYWPFVTALIGLSFAAFITFVLFPAAPPWLASNQGYIAPIHRISSDIWQAMGVTNFSQLYNSISPNPVAAVPSLHAAYPLLFVLFLSNMYGWRRVWWAMVYPISVWLGVVYLGEHYAIDVLLGAVYALAAYYTTLYLFAFKEQRGWQVRRSIRAVALNLWAQARRAWPSG